MTDGDAPPCQIGVEVHRASGVGARHDAGTRTFDGSVDGGELALADEPGEFGLRGRVRATRTAAQPVVVEFDDLGEPAYEQSYRRVGPLHVTQV